VSHRSPASFGVFIAASLLSCGWSALAIGDNLVPLVSSEVEDGVGWKSQNCHNHALVFLVTSPILIFSKETPSYHPSQ
jgi:hypothetical protein